MPRVSFIRQYSITTSLHATVLALNTNAVQQALRELAFVGLSGAEHNVQRQTASVCRQMYFGAKTTARATQPIITGDIGMFF